MRPGSLSLAHPALAGWVTPHNRNARIFNVDIPTKGELLALAEVRDDAVVSIYLATTPVTHDAQADRISLKDLASQSRTELDAVEGLGRGEADEIADELADLVDDDDFWQHQAAGLAVFVTPDHMTVFRLPQSVPVQVHVSDRAHLRPLLGVTSHPLACNVLALSEGGVRLIEEPAVLPPSTIRIKALPRDAASGRCLSR